MREQNKTCDNCFHKSVCAIKALIIEALNDVVRQGYGETINRAELKKTIAEGCMCYYAIEVE